MDLRFQRKLRPIAILVLVFFSWFCIEPWNFAVAAAPPKPSSGAPSREKSSSEKFEETLRSVKKLTQEIDEALASDKEIQPKVDQLLSHQKNIDALDAAIQREFSATEANLKAKNLPAAILDRHQKAVAEYKENIKQLRRNLGDLNRVHGEHKEAKKKGDRQTSDRKRGELKQKAKSARAHLEEKVKERPHQKLDPNNLPHRTPKVQERKPRLKKEEFTEFQKQVQLAFNGDPSLLQLAQATPDLPTPQDLAETIEVQFTQEINTLAASLENNPVKIYNRVHNNIDFVPTWGSIQGADHCLLSKLCNAFDTASLLIAILRSAGIPARYVIGTIIVPIDHVKNWAGGFTDSQSAVELITSGGVPAAGGIIGGKIVETRMEHVWVEAYVDYIPSRGAVHKNGDTWIPLDPSFKHYDFSQTVDLQTAVPFDGTRFLNQVQATATIDSSAPSVTHVDAAFVQTTLENYQNQIQTYLSNNAPTSTLGEILGTRSINAQELSILPATLPYKKLLTGATDSEIPDALRHKLTFQVTTNAAFGPDFTHTASLPALAGKRITLSYSAATPSDQDIIDSYAEAFATSIPAYLLQFRPELKIDGVTTASGPARRMATAQDFTLTFTSPSFGQDQVVHALLVEEYSAVGLNLSRVSADILQRRIDLNDFSEPVGEMLHQTLLSYWGEVDAFNGILASQTQVNTLRHLSEGLATSKLTATYLFGAPNKASYKSRTLDIARDLQTAIHQGGDKSISFSYFTQAGIYSSAWEGLIFDQLFGGNLGDSVSAVRILELANNQGIPIYHVNSSNLTTILPLLQLSNQVKSSIQNAVNAGKTVQIPKQEITHNGWRGAGYIVQDPTTGAGGYLISGGLAGGAGKAPQAVYPIPQIPASPIALFLMNAMLRTAAVIKDGVAQGAGIVIVAGVIQGVEITTAIAADVLAAKIVAALMLVILIAKAISDAITRVRPPENWITLRHYTKAILLDVILTPIAGFFVLESDQAGGECPVNLAGPYLTDSLFLVPDNITNQNEIAFRLGIPDPPPNHNPALVTAYVDIEVNISAVPNYLNEFKVCSFRGARQLHHIGPLFFGERGSQHFYRLKGSYPF